MIFSIDFNSDEALYVQLCNQIIMCIANEQIHEGDSLPSVRQLADMVGINMHTVNKAYTVLRQEGYIKLDRRHGAIIALDIDKLRAMEALTQELKVVIARAVCRNISTDEIHAVVDDVINEFLGG
ncbi:MAG: GntR family transcriptional regulator [Butyrivibrio sp.]|nr:GntR family transcriptional regulator [Butyrivibrio sp.]